MTVWRCFLRPRGTANSNTFDFCLKNSILGIGWPVEGADLVDYEERAEEFYRGDAGWKPAFNAIFNRMKEGDFVFTHLPGGNEFYLGRVGKDLCYSNESGNIRNCAGIGLYRSVDKWCLVDDKILKLGYRKRGPTLHRIHKRELENYAKNILENLRGQG